MSSGKQNSLAKSRPRFLALDLTSEKTNAASSRDGSHQTGKKSEGAGVTGGGLDWLTQAALGKPSEAKPFSPSTSNAPDDTVPAAALSGTSTSGAKLSLATAASSVNGGSGEAENAGDLDWLSTAEVSGQQVKTRRNDVPETVPAQPRTTSHAPAKKVSAASGGWLSAAAASGNFGLSTDNSRDGTGVTQHFQQGKGSSINSAIETGGAPTGSRRGAGGWLTGPIASGNMGAFGDSVDSGIVKKEKARPGTVEMAVQTEEVTITEAISVHASTKPNLPPWAKPWTPPAPAAESASPSPTDVQDPAVANDSEAGSVLVGGGLDWIIATANCPSDGTNGEEKH